MGEGLYVDSPDQASSGARPGPNCRVSDDEADGLPTWWLWKKGMETLHEDVVIRLEPWVIGELRGFELTLFEDLGTKDLDSLRDELYGGIDFARRVKLGQIVQLVEGTPPQTA